MADLPTLRAKVEAVQALAAKATRGPWRSAGDCQSGGLDYVHVEVPIRPEQNVSEAILATIKRYGAHKEKAEGNADLMAAAPDLVTLATDLLVALEAAQAERDEARAELTATRTALGDGADEAAWPPGLTVAQVVERLRGEHHKLRDVLQWVNDQCPSKCAGVCDSALRVGHEGPHAEAVAGEVKP